MFQRVPQLEQRSRAILAAVTILVVIVVGLMDYAANPEVSFSVFYLLAVGVAAWYVGRAFACFISVFCVALSLAGDLLAESHYKPLILFWNASIVLTFYLVVVWLLVRLRLLAEGLEARVRERTTKLTEEIAERERLERELLEISEREQRRIGHDLHDSLGQHLTGAALAGQVLEQKLASRGMAESTDASKLVELVEESILLSRQLAKGLHPIEMEADGLMQALEELAADSSNLFHIKCRFECDSPVLIRDATASVHMYRIAQEAISNAVKHGSAKNVIIQLEALEDGIALCVKDDGTGLPDPPRKSTGMGLRIMAHRASMIGATFDVRRGETGGTNVVCVLHDAEQPAREAHG